MAAPSNTKWGSIVGGKGRIGISVTVSSTNTTSSVHVEAWFWSKYSVSDSNNDYYYDNNATTATTNRGSISISTTVSSGSGWSTSNQKLLKETDYSYNRGTSSVTRNCAAKLSNVDAVGGTMTVTASYTIPALSSYKITYNANGGSGAPGQQTKYYGKTLKLSTTKPSRTGYTFQGWGTSPTGSVVYAPGANYTSNASDTLYAIWKAITYTVSYNANGGSGAPGAQTKTYGVTLTLSSTKPTRSGYNFLGWGTSSGSTTVAYKSGASYTSNAAITLYAIWQIAYRKPRITNLTADRCNSAGTLTDSGTYIKVAFKWASDKTITAASSYVQWVCYDKNGSIERQYLTGKISNTSGSVSIVVGANAIDTNYPWNVTVYLQDASGNSTLSTTVGTAKYIIDFSPNGGVAIGAAAKNSERFDVEVPMYIGKPTYSESTISSNGFEGPIMTEGDNRSVNTKPSDYNSELKFRGLKTNSVIGAPTNRTYSYLLGLRGWMNHSGGGAHELAFNGDGNIYHRIGSSETEWGAWNKLLHQGIVFKQLWTGTLSAGGKATISDLADYNVFILRCSGGATPIFASRMGPGNSTVRGSGAYPTGGNNGETFYVDATASGTSFTLDRLIRISHTEGDTHSAASNVNLTYIFGLL